MNRHIPFPTCFLVGAPRCGTTAMSYYLRAHPGVCFSDPKEPHFFSHVWREKPPRDVQGEYVERFFGAYDPTHHRVLCEGSVSYLYDREALERILELQPEARFLVMVRDPFELLPSYHQRMLYILEENLTSLEVAWRMQERRARGEGIPPRSSRPELLCYAEIGRLGHYVSGLFELAGPERCHVVVYDDLRADPRAAYRGVLAFLGVEDDGREDFRRRMRGRTYRSRVLQHLVMKPPVPIARKAVLSGAGTRARGDSGPKAWLLRARKRLLTRNKVPMPAVALTPAMQQLLRREFLADVALLESLLGRDLGHWLGGGRIAAPVVSPGVPAGSDRGGARLVASSGGSRH